MRPWFIKEGDVIKFPDPSDQKIVRLPSIDHYTSFIDGVMDLQAQLDDGRISRKIYDKLYTDLIHKFTKKESAETPWFMKEATQPDSNLQDVEAMAGALAKITKDRNMIRLGDKKETERAGRPYHLRSVQSSSKKLDKDELQDVLQKLPNGAGINLIPITNPAKNISSFASGDPYQFEYQGKIYYALASTTVSSKSGGPKLKLFAKKELSPVKLGLVSAYNDKKTLANDITKNVNSKYNDDRGRVLLHVLGNAINYQNQTPIPEDLKYILQNKTMLKQISQDFGESVGPILYAKNGKIDFPMGNEPVIDIKIGGVGIAIKSLSGSGNSMVKLKEIIDAYAETIDQKDVKKIARIKTFQKLADPSIKVIDSIIQIAKDINAPEMTALETATKKMKIYNLPQLLNAVEKLIYRKGKPVPYETALATVEKILSASGKTYGMPIDRGTEPALKKYKRDPKIYIAYILTYGMGKGLENVIVNGVDKDAYGELLRDIMKTVDAKAGFVTVDVNGIVSFQIKDFKDLNFKFDYHAYTTKPGNNRPGFVVFP
jgi:hypothetical protein